MLYHVKIFNVYFHEVPCYYDNEVQIEKMLKLWHPDNTTVVFLISQTWYIKEVGL